MEDTYQDPYRPILVIHVESTSVSLVFLSGARILWFGHLLLNTSEKSSDWSELNRICAYHFPKVERIVLDNRPFALLMNLYMTFQEHKWKYVFVPNQLLRYKFERKLNDAAAVMSFAQDWLGTSNTISEQRIKLSKHSHFADICQALLCYMTFVTPDKHVVSNYHPTINDFS